MTPTPTLTRAGIVAAALTTGVLAAPVPPAAAAGNGSCSFGRNDYSCDTGTPLGSHDHPPPKLSAITELAGG
ncbi:MAG: hypothetical protein ACRCYQ_11915 [Nocardioides sp.]